MEKLLKLGEKPIGIRELLYCKWKEGAKWLAEVMLRGGGSPVFRQFLQIIIEYLDCLITVLGKKELINSLYFFFIVELSGFNK